MRLALLSPYTDPVKGGITSYTRELAEGYRRIGVETIGLAVAGQTNSRFEVAGPSRALFGFRCLLRLLATDPTMIHAHSHWYVLLPGVIFRLIRPRTRLIITFHTPPHGRTRTPGFRLLRTLLRFCNGAVFVSRDLMESFRLPSSIPQEVIYAAPEAETSASHIRDQISDTQTIVFVGPLFVPRKVAGILLLLEALSTIRFAFPSWRLVVLGEGPLRPTVERKVAELDLAERVVLRGGGGDVYREIAKAGVYAQISLQEGVPLSMLNAMALGKAVLATRAGGIPEVVTSGITGVLVPPSAAVIASHLAELLGDEPYRRRLGESAMQWVATHLSWEKTAKQYLRFGTGSDA